MLAAVDIGGTKTLVAVAAAVGEPWTVDRLATRASEGGDQLVERAASALEVLVAQHGAEAVDVQAIGVGVGAPVAADGGILLDPRNLGWRGYPLADRLAARTGTPVAVGNDCDLGALGELRDGAGRGASTLVYLGIGTGIGGGVVIGGRLHHGASGNAGELGRLIVDFDAHGTPSWWPQTVEFHASGAGLAEHARALAADGLAPALAAEAGGAQAITAAHVARLAGRGDETALRLWRRGIAALGAAVASMVNALSPEVVVLGGGIPVRAGTPYVEAIAAEARARTVGPNAEATRVVAAALGDDSVVAGALGLAEDLAGARTG